MCASKVDGIEKIGLNCTACHVGQVHDQNRAVRIDGLGNMALVNQFLQDMALETERTLETLVVCSVSGSVSTPSAARAGPILWLEPRDATGTDET